MAKRSNIEMLNDAVDALMAQSSLYASDKQIGPLVQLAADLCDLPQNEFRERLKAVLQTRAIQIKENSAMKESTAIKFREGFHTITPYLAVHEPLELLDFVKKAVAAEQTMQATTGSGGGIHTEVKIGDSMVMIGGGESWRGEQKITSLHLYVEDVDAAYKRAIQAGGKSMYEPVNQDYGDREAGFWDPVGNEWYIATHLEKGQPIPEGLRSVTPILHPKGAHEFIDFAQRAFGAREMNVFKSPDGVVRHAVLQIGDSALELGEAHGQFQPMPSMFYLYVEDVDALYRRAVEAGAASQQEPENQPYGDRVAALKDPFGNTWYLATPIR
jgi:PhnB protein